MMSAHRCPLLGDGPLAVTTSETAARSGDTRRYIAMLCKQGTLQGIQLPVGWLVYLDTPWHDRLGALFTHGGLTDTVYLTAML